MKQRNLARLRRTDFAPPFVGRRDAGKEYWIGIFPNVYADGIATPNQRMVYRDVDYTTLRELTASALAGFQMAGEYGLTWREDQNGKSWFLIHNYPVDRSFHNHDFIYHLVRLHPGGASFEKNYPINAGLSYTAATDLIIPPPFVTDSGHNAAFAIGPDGQVWIPTHGGPRPVDPDTGALGSAVAWPLSLGMYTVPWPYSSLQHSVWRLRGFAASRGGILAQLRFSDFDIMTQEPPPPGVDRQWIARANDVRWRWYFLPWGTSTWQLWAEEVVTPVGEWRTAFRRLVAGGPVYYDGYWLEGTDGTGLATRSMWDLFYDVGGADPRRDVFLGTVNRALTTANRFEMDYEVRNTGLFVRPWSTTRRRRRSVRVAGKTLVHAASAQFGVVTHERFENIEQTVPERVFGEDVPTLTAPQSQWRAGFRG